MSGHRASDEFFALTTCISSKVVQDLSLKPSGKQPIGHAQGSTSTNQYQFQVAFIFPQTVIASGAMQAQVIGMMLTGAEFVAPPGGVFDVLPGRDVLGRGVFSMSFDGHAIFSL
jgi:hypothetical protein